MTDPGYGGTGRWAIMTAGVVGFGLVAFAFGSCASAVIGAAHAASSVARPDEKPLHPVSAYNPDQQQVAFAEATPFPAPAPVRPPTVAAVARAVSAVNLTPPKTLASSTAAPAAQLGRAVSVAPATAAASMELLATQPRRKNARRSYSTQRTGEVRSPLPPTSRSSRRLTSASNSSIRVIGFVAYRLASTLSKPSAGCAS